MNTADKIKAGTTFWAGEDIVTPYQFKTGYKELGYIAKDGYHYCDVRALHDDHMEVFYKFFGSWVEAVIKYKDIAFSTDEIVARITPVVKPKHRLAVGPPRTQEIIQLVRLMDKLCDAVPNGLSSLKDALTFAYLDLKFYLRFGHRNKDFEKALAFARSIPPFDDLQSDECTGWMLHDEEHLKYM